MVRVFSTVRERLDQIIRYGLPHVTRRGNPLIPQDKLTEKENIIFEGSNTNREYTSNNTLIGMLDGHVLEFVLGMQNVPRELIGYQGKIWVSKSYADAIVNAMGVESYSRKEIITGEVLDGDLLECHAFYDPSSDITHYFVLPKRV